MTLIQGDDRVMVGVNEGNDGYLQVFFLDFVPEEFGGAREAYAWVILDSDCNVIGRCDSTKDAIKAGVGFHPSPVEMLRVLVDFLLACAESGPHGENADLFPKKVREWADHYSSELEGLSVDLFMES